jgi:hypothetical protein
MSIQYTHEEIKIIDKNRKKTGEKPAYYNSTTDQTEVISDDFEAYLILQKAASKQKILQRLRQNIKTNTDNTDRDNLIRTLSSNLAANLDKKLAELDVETNNYDEFRTTVLNEDRRFDGLRELTRLLGIIKKPLEETAFHRDQVFQDGNMNILIADRLEISKTDAKTKKEYDVWQKVVSAYQGQS